MVAEGLNPASPLLFELKSAIKSGVHGQERIFAKPFTFTFALFWACEKNLIFQFELSQCPRQAQACIYSK